MVSFISRPDSSSHRLPSSALLRCLTDSPLSATCLFSLQTKKNKGRFKVKVESSVNRQEPSSASTIVDDAPPSSVPAALPLPLPFHSPAPSFLALPAPSTAQTAQTVQEKLEDESSSSAMVVDAADASSSSPASLSSVPTVCLSRPFHPRLPQEPSLPAPPPLASSSLSSLSSITLPSCTPRSIPVSGRVWKTVETQRSSLARCRLPLGWKERERRREQLRSVKAKAALIAEEAKKERQELKRRRQQREKQKEENEKKSRVVQVISSSAKIKRMSRQQRKSIETA